MTIQYGVGTRVFWGDRSLSGVINDYTADSYLIRYENGEREYIPFLDQRIDQMVTAAVARVVNGESENTNNVNDNTNRGQDNAIQPKRKRGRPQKRPGRGRKPVAQSKKLYRPKQRKIPIQPKKRKTPIQPSHANDATNNTKNDSRQERNDEPAIADKRKPPKTSNDNSTGKSNEDNDGNPEAVARREIPSNNKPKTADKRKPPKTSSNDTSTEKSNEDNDGNPAGVARREIPSNKKPETADKRTAPPSQYSSSNKKTKTSNDNSNTGESDEDNDRKPVAVAPRAPQPKNNEVVSTVSTPSSVSTIESLRFESTAEKEYNKTRMQVRASLWKLTRLGVDRIHFQNIPSLIPYEEMVAYDSTLQQKICELKKMHSDIWALVKEKSKKP